MGIPVVDLFAGGGGVFAGCEALGLDTVAAVEWDASACATLRAAGCREVIEGDLREVSWAAWLATEAGWRWKASPTRLLWASPPCQDFSTAGKMKGPAGSRNGFPWTWDALDALANLEAGATHIVLENVPGLLQHNKKAGCAGGKHPKPTACPRC